MMRGKEILGGKKKLVGDEEKRDVSLNHNPPTD